MKASRLRPWVLLCVLAAPMAAHAAQAESLLKLKNTVVNLVDALVDQGVLTREQADALITEAEADAETQTQTQVAAAEPGNAAPGGGEDVVRVGYVPEIVKDEIRAQVREELREDVLADVTVTARRERWGTPDALPDWLSRIRFSGDFRLREQSDLFASDNVPLSSGPYFDVNDINENNIFGVTQDQLFNTEEDRHRLRARFRLLAEADVTESLTVGGRLATGAEDLPISVNQTLEGGDGQFNVNLEWAYLTYAPLNADGEQWLEITAGRFRNPFFHTMLVWDPDLQFEGAVLSLNHRLGSASWDGGGSTSLFLNIGAFPLQEVELSSRDKWLYGGQVGFEHLFANNSSAKLGVAVYDYSNITGQRNEFVGDRSKDFTAPDFGQKGNTLYNLRQAGDGVVLGLASEYTLINVTGSVTLAQFDPVLLTLEADYVKNIAYDKDEILARTGGTVFLNGGTSGPAISDRTNGYGINAQLGWADIEQWKAWQVFIGYEYLQRDAVVDAYADSNFLLGGTDAERFIFGGRFGITRGVWLQGRYYSADALDGAPLGIDTVQLDLNTRF